MTSTANAGETLDFKVTEFSKDEKRIVLSHTSTHTEEKPRQQRKKSGGQRSAVSKINKEVERDTLGDLEALSALKEQMEGSKKVPAKGAPEKEDKPASIVKEEKPTVDKIEEKAEKVKEKEEKTDDKIEEKAEKPVAKKEAEAEPAAEIKTVEPAVEKGKEDVTKEAKDVKSASKAKKKATPKAKKEELKEDAEEEAKADEDAKEEETK